MPETGSEPRLSTDELKKAIRRLHTQGAKIISDMGNPDAVSDEAWKTLNGWERVALIIRSLTDLKNYVEKVLPDSVRKLQAARNAEEVDLSSATSEAIDELAVLDKALSKLPANASMAERDYREPYETVWKHLSSREEQLEYLTQLGGMIEARQTKLATIRTQTNNTRFIMPIPAEGSSKQEGAEDAPMSSAEVKLHVAEPVVAGPKTQKDTLQELLSEAREIAIRIKKLNVTMQEDLGGEEIPYQFEIDELARIDRLDMAEQFVARLVLEEKVNIQIHVFVDLAQQIPAEKNEHRKKVEGTLKQKLAVATTREAPGILEALLERMEKGILEESKKITEKSQWNENEMRRKKLEDRETKELYNKAREHIHELIALEVGLQAAPDIRIIRENYESPLADLSTNDAVLAYIEKLKQEIESKKQIQAKRTTSYAEMQTPALPYRVAEAKGYIGQLVSIEIASRDKQHKPMTDEEIVAYRDRYEGPVRYLSSKVAMDNYIGALMKMMRLEDTHRLKESPQKEVKATDEQKISEDDLLKLFMQATVKNKQLQEFLENEKLQEWNQKNGQPDLLAHARIDLQKEKEDYHVQIVKLVRECSGSGDPQALKNLIALLDSKLLEYKIQRLRVRIGLQIDKLASRKHHGARKREEVREHYAIKLRAIPADYTDEVLKELSKLEEFLHKRVQKHIAKREYANDPKLKDERQKIQTDKQDPEFKSNAEHLRKKGARFIEQLADFEKDKARKQKKIFNDTTDDWGGFEKMTPEQRAQAVREGYMATMKSMSTVKHLSRFVATLKEAVDEALGKKSSPGRVERDQAHQYFTELKVAASGADMDGMRRQCISLEDKALQIIDELIRLSKNPEKRAALKNQYEQILKNEFYAPFYENEYAVALKRIEEFVQAAQAKVQEKTNRRAPKNKMLVEKESSLFETADSYIDQLSCETALQEKIFHSTSLFPPARAGHALHSHETRRIRRLRQIIVKEDLVSYIEELEKLLDLNKEITRQAEIAMKRVADLKRLGDREGFDYVLMVVRLQALCKEASDKMDMTELKEFIGKLESGTTVKRLLEFKEQGAEQLGVDSAAPEEKRACDTTVSALRQEADQSVAPPIQQEALPIPFKILPAKAPAMTMPRPGLLGWLGFQQTVKPFNESDVPPADRSMSEHVEPLDRGAGDSVRTSRTGLFKAITSGSEETLAETKTTASHASSPSASPPKVAGSDLQRTGSHGRGSRNSS